MQMDDNDNLVALADSVSDGLAALLASNDAVSRQRTVRSLQTAEYAVAGGGGNSSPVSCGVFRKMRYIPGKVLEQDLQMDNQGQDQSILTNLVPRSPLVEAAISEDAPSSFPQRFSEDSVSKKSEIPQIESRRSAEFIRSEFKKSSASNRSTSPQGRLKAQNDGQSAMGKSFLNNSPRRSLSPRRNVVGVAVVSNSKAGKNLDVGDEVFNPREPAGAFRRKKPSTLKTPNPVSEDQQAWNETLGSQGISQDGHGSLDDIMSTTVWYVSPVARKRSLSIC